MQICAFLFQYQAKILLLENMGAQVYEFSHLMSNEGLKNFQTGCLFILFTCATDISS